MYTSQECRQCHHTSSKNRQSQAVFICLNCGHTEHADINAAQVIEHRVISHIEDAIITTTRGPRGIALNRNSSGGNQPAREGERRMTTNPGSPALQGGEEVTPSFSEEFNSTTLPSPWAHRGLDYNPDGARYCSKGDPRATSVGGGVATLSVLPDPDRTDLCPTRRKGVVVGNYAYRLNGHIATEPTEINPGYSSLYGVAAARMKFPKAQGQHGGFWLQPAYNAPGGAEIDIVESFGDVKKTGGITSFTYHKNAAGQQVKTGDWIKNYRSFLKGKNDSWFSRYHVFSVEWTPREYIFRIDGRESWRSRVGVSTVPQFPILSLLSSDYEIPSLPNQRLPQSMQVDWVRIWER